MRVRARVRARARARLRARATAGARVRVGDRVRVGVRARVSRHACASSATRRSTTSCSAASQRYARKGKECAASAAYGLPWPSSMLSAPPGAAAAAGRPDVAGTCSQRTLRLSPPDLQRHVERALA